MGRFPEANWLQANDCAVRVVLNPTVQWHLYDSVLRREILQGNWPQTLQINHRL